MQDAFYAEIKRIDQILHERSVQADRVEAEALRARAAANEWRGALRDRDTDFARVETVDRLSDDLAHIRKSVDQSTGRRTAWVAAAGIIATLLAIGVGQILRQGLTSADISSQIQREAPWNRDKAQIERRITLTEAQIARLQVQIARFQGDLRALQIRDELAGRIR